MRKEDFFTGEPVETGSPPNFEEQYTTETEAIQNASFGAYSYDPAMRMMSQPVSIYPGGYGYTGFQGPTYNPNVVNPYFMNPPVGLGSNPYYGGYNPAFAYQQQYQQPQEIKYFIQPVNFSGDYLPSLEYEKEIEQLQMDFWMREQEEAAKTEATSGYNPYSCYNNYYGVPFYNPYQYNNISQEAQQKIREIQDRARDARVQLNFQLSQLAHNLAGEQYNKDELYERFTGKEVSAPGGGMTIADIYQANRFANLVPFDNSQMYRDHDLAASRAYNAHVSKDANMQECFENMGVVNAAYELEEEQHRRRNGATLYNANDNSYKHFVKSKVAEKIAQKNGMQVNPFAGLAQQPSSILSGFPTLSQSAKLTDDGTLNITCNFGSKAGQTYSVHNSQEAEYIKDRERFRSFVDSIPGSIYLSNPNGGDK